MENTSTLCYSVHTPPSHKGPNLGQTHNEGHSAVAGALKEQLYDLLVIITTDLFSI